MSEAEEELRRIAVELRFLETTAESLRSRINFVSAALNELNLANMTLEGIEKEKANASLFVPVGGGSYIKARLDGADKILYGVGAGVAIEKTIKESKEGVSNRISELNKTITSLEQQLIQVFRKMEEDQNKARELASRLETETGASNV